MNLYDSKFVRFEWTDNINGKEVFVSDDIKSLKEAVEAGRDVFIDIVESPTEAMPFRSSGLREDFKFCYYDPMYKYKQAIKFSKDILVRPKGDYNEDHWKMVNDLSELDGLLECFDIKIQNRDPELEYIKKFEDDREFQENYGDFYNSDTAWYSGLNAGWLLHKMYLQEKNLSISNVIGKLRTALQEEKDDHQFRHVVINLIDMWVEGSEKYNC